MKKTLVVLGLVIFAGCAPSQATKIAQLSFDVGRDVHNSTVEALFDKSWQLNQAALNEACAKWVAESTIALNTSAENGVITVERATEIVRVLKSELQTDQTVAGKNYVYLALLMRNYERANSLIGNMDFYLGGQEGLLTKLADYTNEGYKDLKSKYVDLKDDELLTDLRNAWVALKGKLKPKSATSQPVQ